MKFESKHTHYFIGNVFKDVFCKIQPCFRPQCMSSRRILFKSHFHFSIVWPCVIIPIFESRNPTCVDWWRILYILRFHFLSCVTIPIQPLTAQLRTMAHCIFHRIWLVHLGNDGVPDIRIWRGTGLGAICRERSRHVGGEWYGGARHGLFEHWRCWRWQW